MTGIEKFHPDHLFRQLDGLGLSQTLGAFVIQGFIETSILPMLSEFLDWGRRTLWRFALLTCPHWLISQSWFHRIAFPKSDKKRVHHFLRAHRILWRPQCSMLLRGFCINKLQDCHRRLSYAKTSDCNENIRGREIYSRGPSGGYLRSATSLNAHPSFWSLQSPFKYSFFFRDAWNHATGQGSPTHFVNKSNTRTFDVTSAAKVEWLPSMFPLWCIAKRSKCPYISENIRGRLWCSYNAVICQS